MTSPSLVACARTRLRPPGQHVGLARELPGGVSDDERIPVRRGADDIDGAGSEHEKRNHAIAGGKEHITLADGPRGPVVRNPLDLRRRQRREHEPHAFGGDGRRERCDETHASVYRQLTGERHIDDVLTAPPAVRATITLRRLLASLLESTASLTFLGAPARRPVVKGGTWHQSRPRGRSVCSSC